MNRITEYTLVSGYCEQVLIQAVNNRIEDGWQPYGPPLYNHCHEHSSDVEDSHYYAQAMVRYGKGAK